MNAWETAAATATTARGSEAAQDAPVFPTDIDEAPTYGNLDSLPVPPRKPVRAPQPSVAKPPSSEKLSAAFQHFQNAPRPPRSPRPAIQPNVRRDEPTPVTSSAAFQHFQSSARPPARPKRKPRNKTLDGSTQENSLSSGFDDADPDMFFKDAFPPGFDMDTSDDADPDIMRHAGMQFLGAVDTVTGEIIRDPSFLDASVFENMPAYHFGLEEIDEDIPRALVGELPEYADSPGTVEPDIKLSYDFRELFQPEPFSAHDKKQMVLYGRNTVKEKKRREYRELKLVKHAKMLQKQATITALGAQSKTVSVSAIVGQHKVYWSTPEANYHRHVIAGRKDFLRPLKGGPVKHATLVMGHMKDMNLNNTKHVAQIVKNTVG